MAPRIRHDFCRDELLGEVIYHFEVASAKPFNLFLVRIKVGVMLAQQIFDRCAVSFRHSLIDQRKTTLPVFGEDEIGIEINNLTKKGTLFSQLVLSARALFHLLL